MWYLLTLLTVLLGTHFPSFYNTTADHPYHMGAVEVEYNDAEQRIEISCKLFVDDVERVIAQEMQKNIALKLDENRATANPAVASYLLKNLKVYINNTMVPLSFLGYEVESDAVYIYVEGNQAPKPGSIKVENTLLYDLFKDQLHIVHIICEGKRYSDQISYPEKVVEHHF